VAVAYAGKDSKGHRGGLVHFVSNERPAYFWPLLKARVAQSYVLKDISTLYASHDAAGWCKNHRLDILAPTAQVLCHLDAFHVNRAVHRVFGVGKVASYVIGLIYSKRTKKLFSTLDRAVAHAQKGSCRKRYLELYNYLRSNVSLIGQGRYPSMGTMEGTNAHVYAARMKVWGGAWSRAGALAMALVRAHIASGHPLIAPKTDNVLLSDVQKQRRRDFEESLLDGHWRINFTEGSGWEPPQGSINLKAQMTPRLYGLLKNP
jgi:hypothetical protein